MGSGDQGLRIHYEGAEDLNFGMDGKLRLLDLSANTGPRPDPARTRTDAARAGQSQPVKASGLETMTQTIENQFPAAPEIQGTRSDCVNILRNEDIPRSFFLV